MKAMTSIERVLTTLSHQEPDRVPMFLLLTMHGAKELGISIQEYFSKAENVAEGQLRMQKKYQNDCFYPFFYAPLEVEAFGAEVIFTADGPPNSGQPVIQDPEKIWLLEPPKIQTTPVLHKVLKAIELIKQKSGGDIPIIAVVMSPFSLPVMQLGFDRYLELMHFNKPLFNRLMEINSAFCVDWANAQLKAGATAICYFDPVSSTSMISPEMYAQTGFLVAKDTISKIKGPTATHFASGNCLPLADLLPQTGTAIAGVSIKEDIGEIKAAFRNKLSILGNLNGIEMRRWTTAETITEVKNLIRKAGPGGGFILADNHGEIPFQVSDDTLLTIRDTVKEFGRYPINPD